jgi:hypothetical protein
VSSGGDTVNLDTVAAFSLISEGSPQRHLIRGLGQSFVMCETALSQFQSIIAVHGGPREQARAQRLHSRVLIVPDQPSERARQLRTTGNLDTSDIIILATGDELGCLTATGDGKAVRAAAAQGVLFRVTLHPPVPLTGQ